MKIYRISINLITCKDCGYKSVPEDFKGKGVSVINRCPKCGYKWIPQTSVFDEVQPIGRSMSYAAKVPQAPIYMINEKGLLEDENADEVFTFKEYVGYNIPLFKTPQQANAFLEQLEQDKERNPTGRRFGRVSEEDLLGKLRREFKDTRKEKEQAKLQEHLERNKQVMRGQY